VPGGDCVKRNPFRVAVLRGAPQEILQMGAEDPRHVGGGSFVCVESTEIDDLPVIALEGRDLEAIRRDQNGLGRCDATVDLREPVMAFRVPDRQHGAGVKTAVLIAAPRFSPDGERIRHFQGFLGHFPSLWPSNLISFSIHLALCSEAFESSWSRSRSCFRGKIFRSSRELMTWQRVRGSNPYFSLERALIYLRKMLMISNL
jgi:hypothetical protein